MPDEKDTIDNADLGFSETYDTEGDTYYVTFKTGEPSYCVEADDVLVLEIGLFSRRPTGFRILNYSTLRRLLEAVTDRGCARPALGSGASPYRPGRFSLPLSQRKP